MSKKLTLDFVKEEFKRRGYTLLSKKYTGAFQKLKFKCSKGHIRYITWSHFKYNRKCIECVLEDRSLNIDYVWQCFEDRGYTLKSDSISDSKQKLDYICKKGHSGAIRWNDFQQGHGCLLCADSSISSMSQRWLDSLGIDNIIGKTREVPFVIKGRKILVDGFDSSTNTIYEFLGDYWHGNPERFPSGKTNKTVHKTFGFLYKFTMERLNDIRKEGFNLVYIWEGDYSHFT